MPTPKPILNLIEIPLSNENVYVTRTAIQEAVLTIIWLALSSLFRYFPPAMNIGEILVWESTNALLLIPVVIGLVMLVRWIRRRAVFTEKDWLFLFGHPREKVLSLHLWLRFAMLWVAVVLVGFVEGYV